MVNGIVGFNGPRSSVMVGLIQFAGFKKFTRVCLFQLSYIIVDISASLAGILNLINQKELLGSAAVNENTNNL